ncbi:MAG: antibiotic biosynthesis monooxygenase [Phycisphaeraceae bacterium]|nr:antibiotic biosynthesis monooxygenase [Phycisphaeraceae bacterium]
MKSRGRIELHLRIRVHAGGGEALRAFLREAMPFYTAPGGITIELLQDRADPCRFIELVTYADEAAFEADQRRVDSDPGMIALLQRWRSLLAEPPVVEVYRPADV